MTMVNICLGVAIAVLILATIAEKDDVSRKCDLVALLAVLAFTAFLNR